MSCIFARLPVSQAKLTLRNKFASNPIKQSVFHRRHRLSKTSKKMTTMASVKPSNIPDGDFANYFCTYGYLYHQKEMLEDPVRMRAYHDSVFLNKKQFMDKVVLDVGTGSGILAIWAAQAGARKVYAVEATNMATHARKLADANGVGDRIEFIQGYMEQIELPEKVDVIISEWMGYFLLRESMLDSVLVARDKWLKPGGALYPSHARMFISAIRSNATTRKFQDYQDSLANWHAFTKNTHDNYGVDLSCLTSDYDKEQATFFLKTSQWVDLHPDQRLGKAAVLKEFDLNTCSIEDIKVVKEKFQLVVEGPGGAPQHRQFNEEGDMVDDDTNMAPETQDVQVSAFGAWFDVHFRGSAENPAETEVELSTAPDANGATHWGQQCFYLHPPAVVGAGDTLEGNLQMQRSKENHRLMNVQVEFSHHRVVNGTSYAAPPRTCNFNIE